MVSFTKVKLYKYKLQHSIYLPNKFVMDSQFPFKPGDELIAKIVGKTIIIEKVVKQEKTKA